MLRPPEVFILTTFFDSSVALIEAKFAKVRATFSSDEQFRAEMQELESQRLSDADNFSKHFGYIPDTVKKMKFLAAGLDEYVAANLLYVLTGNSLNNSTGDFQEFVFPVVVAALRNAMAQNEDLRVFVKAVMLGAAKHWADFIDCSLFKRLNDMI